MRVRVASAAKVELRASAPGVRRLSGRDRVTFDEPGSKKLNLLITGPGRTALEGASSRCEELTVLVKAQIDRKGRGKAGSESAERPLSPDQSRCAKPAPGPGQDPAPGDGTTPEPTPDPSPNPNPDPDPDPDPVETNLQAGAATADITPPVGTPMFAYTARSRIADPPQDQDSLMQMIADPAPDHNHYAKSFEPSEGIHARLRASAIVIERDGEKFALVQADLGGLPYAMVQAVEDRLTGTGIDGEHIILSATHTHSATGPIWPADSAGYQALGGDFFDPRVFGITADGIAEAVINADERLEPARVGLGTSQLADASNNRAFEAFQRNGDVPDSREQELKLDRTVTVLRVDAANGEPIGLWSNFAVHQTSFGDENLLLSGDNAATTARLVEREVALESGQPEPAPGAPGETHGPVLVWSNGAEGDVSPNGNPRSPDGEELEYRGADAAGANMAGIKVADGIVTAWDEASGALTGDLELEVQQTFRLLDGDFAEGAMGEPVGPLTVLGAGEIAPELPEPPEDFPAPPGGWPKPPPYCAPEGATLIPGQGRKMPAVAGTGLVPLTAPVSLMRVGDTAITSMPFEITTQMGRRINDAVVAKSGGEFESSVIAGLSNGYMSYTATPEEFDHCGYEGSFTLFGRQQGPLLRDTAASLVPSLLGGSDPVSDPEPPSLAFEAENMPASEPTPAPETAVTQPSNVNRFGRTSFTWRGGDPSVDAPRGHTFVSLQHRTGSGWETIGTDDGPESTTVYDDDAGTWTETWQFSNCEPLGTYRFVATGIAVKVDGGAPEPYAATSGAFELGSFGPLQIIDSSVTGNVARVRARYPDPGADSLLALPRRVRDGEATLSLSNGQTVTATPDSRRLAFEAKVPPGQTISDISVTDGCGNSTG